MHDAPTVLIVPGLRDDAPGHWQTLLARRLPRVALVPPMGRADLDCARRVAAIETVASAISGPVIAVAHSGGCIMLAHWLRETSVPLAAALMATPPDFERPMPDGYPSLDELQTGGWLPVPRDPLPCPALVAASQNDPLASFDRISALASDWRAWLVDLGRVGHLNPASGFGDWPMAEALISELQHQPQPACG